MIIFRKKNRKKIKEEKRRLFNSKNIKDYYLSPETKEIGNIEILKNGIVRKYKRNKIRIYTPTEYRIAKKRKIITTSLATAFIAVFISFNNVFIQSAKMIFEKIEVGKRPPYYYQELIPEFINENNTIKNSTNNESETGYLNLSDKALKSVEIYKKKINTIYKRNLPDFAKSDDIISPAFMIIHYESQLPISYKLICDVNNETAVILEFSIDSPKDFDNTLISNSLEVPDIVNSLTTNTSNLLDTPTKLTTITKNKTKYYCDKIEESCIQIGDTENGPSNIEDCYEFKIYNHTDKNILEQTAYIIKKKTKTLDCFDENNLEKLYTLYFQDRSQFEKNSSSELEMDSLSLILLSAKKMNQESQKEFFTITNIDELYSINEKTLTTKTGVLVLKEVNNLEQ